MIETAPASFIADPVLLKSITDAVEQALQMCDSQASCVAIARVPARDPGSVTGLIGVHGSVSGFITVNLAERVAKSIVGGLLQDNFEALTGQVIDGVGELTNIIAGGIKKGVLGTPWAFANVTVPSVIVGRNYQIAYCRGLEYLSATFEQQNDDAVMLDDRLLQVAVSLIRL
jgi:chemotaxis protein CheX